MSIRTERLGAVIQRDLGEILQQDYQMSGTFITVTRVRVTPDLSIAKIYISVFSPERDSETVFQYIDEHTSEIRYELAGRIRHQVRRIPELHFYVDDSAEYVNRMEHLFKKVKGKDSEENGNDEED
ncbi:MAG: 30S ribosome-binding factor RbfA [Balneolaceae bacterium]